MCIYFCFHQYLVQGTILLIYLSVYWQLGVSNCSFFEIWGRPVLTGCVITYASMQAHGVRALKDSPKPYLASLTTPWLLNLSDRVN